jgi:hypothetical protein
MNDYIYIAYSDYIHELKLLNNEIFFWYYWFMELKLQAQL